MIQEPGYKKLVLSYNYERESWKHSVYILMFKRSKVQQNFIVTFSAKETGGDETQDKNIWRNTS